MAGGENMGAWRNGESYKNYYREVRRPVEDKKESTFQNGAINLNLGKDWRDEKNN